MVENEFGKTADPGGAPYIDAKPTSEARTWAALCHLSGFLGYVVVIPFASIIGPLVVWLLKKDSSVFVDAHGKEAINFQITMSIAYAFAWFLFLSVVFTLIAGFVLFPVLGLWIVVLVVLAAVKAINGERFRYPLIIRFVK